MPRRRIRINPGRPYPTSSAVGASPRRRVSRQSPDQNRVRVEQLVRRLLNQPRPNQRPQPTRSRRSPVVAQPRRSGLPISSAVGPRRRTTGPSRTRPRRSY